MMLRIPEKETVFAIESDGRVIFKYILSRMVEWGSVNGGKFV
jgi:hypothetical protein